jgi:hypothetical protein
MARAPLSACRTPRFARDPLFCAAGIHVRIRTPKCKVRILGPGVPGGGGSLLSLLARDGCSGKPHSRGKTQRFTETRRAERDDHGRLPCGLPTLPLAKTRDSDRQGGRADFCQTAGTARLAGACRKPGSLHGAGERRPQFGAAGRLLVDPSFQR